MTVKVHIKPPAEWEYIGERNTHPPIRTRREIVPGVYGRVDVRGIVDGRALIIMNSGTYKAEELREAAHLFNQIAEVLEENAG